MMTEPHATQNPFFTQLEKAYQQIGENDPLEKFRAKAWDHFLELGLPTVKSEVFRYIRLRQLYQKQIVPLSSHDNDPANIIPYIYPECASSCLVFINGRFSMNLSRTSQLPKKVVVMPLDEALRTYGALLSNQWSRSLKEETDPFAVLNTALHPKGLFIYIPPKCVVEQPIQILNIVGEEQADAMISPRLHVFAGSRSEAEFVSNAAAIDGGRYVMNMSIDLSIEDDSKIRYNQGNCSNHPECWHFEALRASLKRNSSLTTILATNGGATTRHDYRVQLNGENGEALLNGIWMLSQKREAHTHVLVDHQAPNCRSMQLFKGALNDFGRSSFEGKILVRQAAQKTDAFQLNNNLLLSERALAYSKPNLEIFADDVKASHGSTVGQIDAEQLFYLKTRGLNEEDAKSILVFGYCKEVIDMIRVPSLLNDVTACAESFIVKG